MPRRSLTVAMQDAWRLVDAAVQAERLDLARILADEAAKMSGWHRYRPVGSRWGVDVWACDLMPRGWAYFGRPARWDLMLLIHWDARAFLTETVGFRTIREVALTGPGLVRLEEVLAAVLFHGMTAPDMLP